MSGGTNDSRPEGSADIARVAALLQKYEVDCILVGGSSAVLHGSETVTLDVDTVAVWERPNLERLCRALNSVDAEIMIKGAPDGDPANEQYRAMPGGLDVDDIRHTGSFRVRTRDGDRIDTMRAIPLEPGPNGHRATYGELLVDAELVDVSEGVAIRQLSRARLIESKLAAGRPHDLAVVRELAGTEAEAADHIDAFDAFLETPQPKTRPTSTPDSLEGGTSAEIDPHAGPDLTM